MAADPAGSESPPGPANSTFSRWDREGTLSVSDADEVSSTHKEKVMEAPVTKH